MLTGKNITGKAGAKTCDTYSLLDLSSLLVNKSFPVAYDSTNESSSIMILSVKHAKRFNIEITDTLLHYDSIIKCEKVFGALSKY